MDFGGYRKGVKRSLALFLADLSKITSTQVIAIAAHKLSSTSTLVLTGLQSKVRAMIVIRTASNEMEQPTVEIISRASLSSSFPYKI